MASKGRKLARLIVQDSGDVDVSALDNAVVGAGDITSDKLADNLAFPGDHIVIPTGSEPSTTTSGSLYFDTSDNGLKNYTSQGWAKVSQQPPKPTSISGVINENTSTTITITGENFAVGDVIYITGAAVSNTDRALSTSFVDETTLTANTNASSVNFVGAAGFNVKVEGSSGLNGTLYTAGTVDRDPVWSTAAGNVADISDASSGTHATLNATDPDGTTVTYTIANGSFPGGLSFDTNSGNISGNPTDVSNDTTFTFEVEAESNSQTASRTFNIIVRKTLDGTASDRAPNGISALGSNVSLGAPSNRYVNLNGTVTQLACGGQLSDIGTIPSGAPSWVSNIQDFGVIVGGSGNNYGNYPSYFLSQTGYQNLMYDSWVTSPSNRSPYLYWAVFEGSTLWGITRTWWTSTTASNWWSGHVADGSPGGTPHWDVWKTGYGSPSGSYTVSDHQNMVRAVLQNQSYSGGAEYGIHYKRESDGEHYPWFSSSGQITSNGYFRPSSSYDMPTSMTNKYHWIFVSDT